MIAAPLHHGGRRHRHARLLLAPPAYVRLGGRPRRERRREPRRSCDRDGVRLPEAGAAGRDAPPARRGERRPRLVARLRDDARERRCARRPAACRLVRRRHRRRGRRDSAARGRSRGSGEGRAGAVADREAAVDPDSPQRRPGGDPDAAARVAAGDRRRAASRRPSATGPTCSRSCGSSASAAR